MGLTRCIVQIVKLKLKCLLIVGGILRKIGLRSGKLWYNEDAIFRLVL